MPKPIWFVVAIALLMGGALGFRTMNECNNDPLITTDADKAICYHQAAISVASTSNVDGAVGACQAIRNIPISTSAGQADMCLMDVAILLKDAGPCTHIRPSNPDTILFGAEVTQAVCQQKIANINRAREYRCALLYALPLLGAAIYFHRDP